MLALIYSLLVILYIIYVYFLILIQNERYYPDFNEHVSVIIPIYNENEKELKECINSIINAKGNK